MLEIAFFFDAVRNLRHDALCWIISKNSPHYLLKQYSIFIQKRNNCVRMANNYMLQCSETKLAYYWRQRELSYSHTPSAAGKTSQQCQMSRNFARRSLKFIKKLFSRDSIELSFPLERPAPERLLIRLSIHSFSGLVIACTLTRPCCRLTEASHTEQRDAHPAFQLLIS